jgi:hypothetical protein
MESTIVYCSSDQLQNELNSKSRSKESIDLENLLNHLLLDSDCNLPHAEVLLHLNDYEKINITETLVLSSHVNKYDHEYTALSKLISTASSSTFLDSNNSFAEEDLYSLALSIDNLLYPPSTIISTIQKQEDCNFEWEKGSAVLKGENTYDGSVHIRPLCTSQDVFLAIRDLMDVSLFSRGFIQITPYNITKKKTENNENMRNHTNDDLGMFTKYLY